MENIIIEVVYCFIFFELEEVIKDFEKKIGFGGYGVVYYGKLKDGREIVVKVLISNFFQGKREFLNEVFLIEVFIFFF